MTCRSSQKPSKHLLGVSRQKGPFAKALRTPRATNSTTLENKRNRVKSAAAVAELSRRHYVASIGVHLRTEQSPNPHFLLLPVGFNLISPFLICEDVQRSWSRDTATGKTSSECLTRMVEQDVTIIHTTGTQGGLRGRTRRQARVSRSVKRRRANTMRRRAHWGIRMQHRHMRLMGFQQTKQRNRSGS